MSEDADHLHEKCDRCGIIGQDRRTLYMACLFEMSGLGVPFLPFAIYGEAMRHTGTDPRWGTPTFERIDEERGEQQFPFYTLRVCKRCRAEWLDAIVAWFRGPPDPAINAFNNDERLRPEPVSTLLADAERLRTDLLALQSRFDALMPELRTAHAQYDNLKGPHP